MISQIAANGFFFGIVVGLLGLAFSITYMGSRFFSFTFGGSYVVAAYTVLALSETLPFWCCVGIGVLLGSALGVALEGMCYQPLRVRYDNPMVLMLASIGIYTVIQNLISIFFGDTTRSYRKGLSSTIRLLDVVISETQMLIMGLSLLTCGLVYLGLRLSQFGRLLRALSNNANLAQAVGLDTSRVSMIAVAFGSAIGGFAAILQGLDTDLTPTIGFSALLYAIVASVIVGPRRPLGAAFAGLVVGLISHLAVWRLPSQWQDGVGFLVLGLILYFRPQGLLERA